MPSSSSSIVNLVVGTNAFNPSAPTNCLYAGPFDIARGRFGQFSRVECSGNPGFLCRAAEHLYAADESQEGNVRLVEHRRDGSIFVSPTSFPTGDMSCHVSYGEIKLNGLCCIVSTCNYTSGTVRVHRVVKDKKHELENLFDIDHNASLYGAMRIAEDLHDRQESAHPHCSFVVEGRYLVVVDLGCSCVASYDLLGKHGVPRQCPEPTSVFSPGPSHGCRHAIVVDGDMYIVNECTASLTHCKFAAGEFTLIETLSLLEEGEEPTRQHHRGAGGIAVDEKGCYIYVTLRHSTPGKLVALARGEGGRVKVKKRVDCGGDVPRAITTVDEHVYVANRDNVCCFSGNGNLELLDVKGGFDEMIAFIDKLC